MIKNYIHWLNINYSYYLFFEYKILYIFILKFILYHLISYIYIFMKIIIFLHLKYLNSIIQTSYIFSKIPQMFWLKYLILRISFWIIKKKKISNNTVGDLNVKRDLNVIAKIFKIFIKNFNILHFSPDIKNLIINEIH